MAKRTKKTSKVKIDKLMDEVSEKPIRAHCWVDRIEDPEALEFIAQVKTRFEAGKFVNHSEVKRILLSHFEVSIGLGRVTAHVKDECVCPRKRSRG